VGVEVGPLVVVGVAWDGVALVGVEVEVEVGVAWVGVALVGVEAA